MLDAFLTRMPILPIDTGRYGSPEMRHIFDEENKLQKWLDVEAAVAEAEASVGDIPKEAADDIAKNANTKTVTLARTKEIEKETRHDLMSMVMALTEACKGEGKKYVHYGLTRWRHNVRTETRCLALRDKTPEETVETGPRTGSRWKNPRHCRNRCWTWKERAQDPGKSTESSGAKASRSCNSGNSA